MSGAEIPESIWLQFGALILFMLFIGGAGRVLINFITARDAQWQAFLKEQRATDQNTMRDLMTEVKNLAEELVRLRGDFDRAVDVMKERTQPIPRRPSRPKGS